ncbi:MAG: hypothetical protein AB8H86_31190 [Polyangiales bacterium]
MQRTWTTLTSPALTLWALTLMALGCGGSQQTASVSEVQLPAEPAVEEGATQRSALEALSGIRRDHPDLSGWRPTAVMRLDDSIAVLDDSHAFIWEEDAWRHVELPGPAPFGVGSMGAPEVTAKGDGHRVVFAGPSAPDAQTIGLFQLTRAGVESLGVLPEWVAACRSVVASGSHVYAVVSDEPREREGTVLHAEAGAAPEDWQPLNFVFRSNEPDRQMFMSAEGAILHQYSEACELLRLPSEGPSFEPRALHSIQSERPCDVYMAQGLTPSRMVVTGTTITVFEEGARRELDWPADGAPFDRPGQYDGYDQLTPSERAARENDSMARTMSPGLVALRPLLYERLHPAGEPEQQRGAFRLPLSSSFHREEGGTWVALPEEEGEPTAMVAAMHYGALTRPKWTTPVNWGPYRIAVATGRWASETPTATLGVWRADSPELITSAFPSLSRR